MKSILIALAVVVLIGGGYYWYTQNEVVETTTIETTEEETVTTYEEPTITWKMEDAGETDNIPYTNVTVTVNGKAYDMGKFQGSCVEIGATGGVDGKGLLAGELSAVQCWFAGGGDEIGVFAHEDGGFDILVGALEEPIEGSAGFRGDFEVKHVIEG